MVKIRKITRENPLSAKRRYRPEGGTAFRALGQIAQDAYDNFLEPLAIEEMEQRAEEDWRGYAKDVMANNRIAGPQQTTRARDGSGDDVSRFSRPPPVSTTGLQGLVDQTEGGGDYDTLFGFSNRSGPFAGTRISQMTIGQLKEFSKVSGEYGQWVASQVGRVATPMGRYQIIGTTLRSAAKALGLSDDTVFNRETQDRLFNHLATERIKGKKTMAGKRNALRQEWEGFKHVSDEQLDQAIQDFEAGKEIAADTRAALEQTSDGEQIASDTMEVLFPGENVAPAAQTEQGGQQDAPQDGRSVVASRGSSVTIRTSDGRLEPRLYSPASGPILQAYNAAASVAALSEVSTQAQIDLLNLSQEYRTDPQGFQQAAESYIETVTESFDERMRGDIRATMADEVQRRTLGIIDEKHRDIQARADNSSRALVKRLSQDYADAIAAGDEGEIARTRAELDDVLYAREQLPGVSWTPEQSENVFLEAQRTADRISKKRRADQEKEWKSELNLIVKARKEGLTAANEAILSNPEVWAAHPDLAREAQAMVLFQNQVPSFQQMTPAQMDAAIEEMERNPISEEFQMDILDSARSIRDTQAAGFDEDPIKRAQAVLENKPPEIGKFDPMNPQGFIDGIEARVDYVNSTLVGEGYISDPVYLSKEEVSIFSEVMSKEMPDEVRGIAAQTLVEGFGEAAVDVFDQMEVPAEIALAGKLTAAGGPPEVMQTVLSGQRMLDDGLVKVPSRMSRLETFPEDFQTALSDLPVAVEENFAQVRDLAQTIYAGTVAGKELTDEQQDAAMQSAINLALGQGKDAKGRTTGGVQKINDNPVWLPIGVSGEEVEKSLDFIGQTMKVENIRLFRGENKNADSTEMWLNVAPEDVPASLPYLGGEPLDGSHLMNGNIQLKPDDQGTFRMVYVGGTVPRDVAREDGSVYRVDLNRLMEATLP